jgi:putative membrane protein
MIVGKPKHGLALLVTLHGSVLPRILPRILMVICVAAGITWFDTYIAPLQHAGATAFTAFGVALSLFLGFRNNAAYERWWEARKLWGQLIADGRAFARETQIFLPDTTRTRALQLFLGFIHLHRCNLRGLPPDQPCRYFAGPIGPSASLALDDIAAPCAPSRQDAQLSDIGARVLSERLATIGLAQAGCERIANTPLPFVYSLLVYRTAILYCFLLPLGVVETAGWLTPLFAGVVAYVFFGLAEVTEELETPFGTSVNGLALDAMCRVLERDLLPQLGQPAPPPHHPIKGYLS